MNAVILGQTARRLLDTNATFELQAAFSGAAHFVAPGGELLVLAGDPVAAPWVINVPGLAYTALTQGRKHLVVEGEALRLEPGGLRITLESARLWESPPIIGAPAPTEAIAAALTQAGLPEAAPGLTGYAVEAALAGLRTALADDVPELISLACMPLIGLGRGLTPAGDDLVTGVLGVMALSGQPCRLPPLTGRTTLPAATQLAHAARGALIEPLHNVISALLAGTTPPSHALAHLLALGHSSGADMLAGVHLALQSRLLKCLDEGS